MYWMVFVPHMLYTTVPMTALKGACVLPMNVSVKTNGVDLIVVSKSALTTAMAMVNVEKTDVFAKKGIKYNFLTIKSNI